MPWAQDDDLDDPSLYIPRDTPRVQKAAAQIQGCLQAPLPATPDFRFDEEVRWSDSLDDLPLFADRSPASQEALANPYAQRCTPGGASMRFPSSRTQTGGKPQALPQGRPMLYAAVIAVCLALLVAIGVMMMPQMAGYFWKDLGNYAFINGEMLRYEPVLVGNYKQYRDYLRQEMIYQGVFIDGVHVGGMTLTQAQAVLQNEADSTANAFSLTISIGNKSWTLDNRTVAATRNLDTVLRQAYAIGKQNTTAIIGTNLTPFRERVNTMLTLLEKHVYLNSTATYDHEAVRAKINEIATYVTRDPVDSVIESFNPNTRTFTFTDEQPGVTIDAEALYQQVTAKLNQGVVGEILTIAPTITTPAISKTDMMNNFKLVSAFTTDTTSDRNRNNNIGLACAAINGKVLLPGESFSFNTATGQRTTSKGYKSAGAIAAGQSIEEVGGGICQVSSTLFNAVARADLEITSRSPHAWPSSYVKIGEDATVNWPNLDFAFRNNKNTPVFVIAYYKDRKCSAEIWGMALGTGVTIDLSSRILKTTEPPTEIKYVQNPALAAGESIETIKARTGYVVDTYKVWYKDGQEAKRELLHTSTYKTYQRTVEYN